MGATNNYFREKKGWSLTKDEIVSFYLKPYINKIIRTKKPLVIVDCFAGKGKFDDGTIGSPLIISDRINEVISRNSKADISAIFIEKKYHSFLKRNTSHLPFCKVLPGTFEDNTKEILVHSDNSKNLFLYIDPYGILSLDFSRFQKFCKARFSSIEMLLNFNSFGFLREGCRLLKYENEFTEDDSTENYEIDSRNSFKKMNSIAGGDYWQAILHDFDGNIITMHQAEELFMKKYLEQFNSIFDHVVNIPIKSKLKNIPKYRLVFGTNHEDGLILMANNMSRRWKEIIENEREGQVSMFDIMDDTNKTKYCNLYEYPDFEKEKGYDPRKDILDILVSHNDYLPLKTLIILMIKKYGISFTDKKYIDIVKKLQSDNIVDVLRYPSKTPTGKLSRSFDYNKFDIKVRLKWKKNM